MLAGKIEEQKIFEYHEAQAQRERDLEDERARLAADKAEEIEQQRQRQLAAEKVMLEVNAANTAATKIKEDKMLAEKIEEQKITEYQEAKARRERGLEGERARLAAEKAEEIEQ